MKGEFVFARLDFSPGGTIIPLCCRYKAAAGLFSPAVLGLVPGVGGAAPRWKIYLHLGDSAQDTGSEDGAEPALLFPAATHHLKHLLFPRHLKRGGLVEFSKHVEKTWVLIWGAGDSG